MNNKGSKAFARNLKQYRIAAQMTQEDLQKALGYKSKSSIGKLENCDQDITIEMLIKMAKVLNVSVADLTKGVLDLETSSNFEISDYVEFYEFLPYLKKANQITLTNIKLILGMPVAEKKNSESLTEQVG